MRIAHDDPLVRKDFSTGAPVGIKLRTSMLLKFQCFMLGDKPPRSSRWAIASTTVEIA
jgi:hypothetical protein